MGLLRVKRCINGGNKRRDDNERYSLLWCAPLQLADGISACSAGVPTLKMCLAAQYALFSFLTAPSTRTPWCLQCLPLTRMTGSYTPCHCSAVVFSHAHHAEVQASAGLC